MFALLLVNLVVCLSCGEAGIPAHPAAPGGGREAWTVELHLSGSIVGRSEDLTVNESGLLKFANRRLRFVRQGHLDPDRQEKISGLLVGLPEQDDAGPAGWFNGRCRDCLVFRLSWRTKGKAQTVRLSSDRLAQSPYLELIDVLLDIMKEYSSPADRVRLFPGSRQIGYAHA